MRSTASTISVLERPDGVFVARCESNPGLNAEGASAIEAEDALLELIRLRRDAGRPSPAVAPVFADPDEIPAFDEAD